jgi:hypothetical protein
MDPLARFADYASTFEKVFENDDWSLLDPFFSEDAVYEIVAAPPLGGRHAGREQVFRALRESLDGFDRRFDSRELEILEGPRLEDGKVWLSWRATYRVAGAPPLVMEGEERAWLEGSRISRLEDRFSEETQQRVPAFLAEHGSRLKTT